MSAENGGSGFYVTRLDFLRYSLASSVAVWAGAAVPGGLGVDEAEAQELFGAAGGADSTRFPQSVASGDPKPNGIVLWTRVQPPAGTSGTLRVGYRVALDDSRSDEEAFARPVLSGIAETNAARDHTLKVQLQNSRLRPFEEYRYRFYYGGSHSRTGRFKTLPAPDKRFAADESIRLAYVSCQDYTNGYYHALRFLAMEEVDFVVHLGDYIYETVGDPSFQSGGPEERQFLFPRDGAGDDGREALSLADYRFAYKKYRTDPYLQEVHENFAFITIWDDHEFANDAYRVYAPDQGGTDDTPSRNPSRREAANRAWAEFIPAGVPYNASAGPLEELRIYRSFVFGDLMELVMTDERLYRDGPPCGNRTEDRYLTPGCNDVTTEEGEGEEAPGRTMLSSSQRDNFFLSRLRNSRRTWKFWGNEVMFMQFKVLNTYLDALFRDLEDYPSFPPIPDAPADDDDLGDDGVYVTLDQWDGYQAERRTITRTVRDRRIKNFVTLTGDIHSYLAGYLKYDYDSPAVEPGNQPVGVEFVCGSVTSSNLTELASFGRGRAPVPNGNEFTAAATVMNPHMTYFNSDNHGYNLIELTKDSLVCTMVGLFTSDPEVNPIRVEYERNAEVERVVIKEFLVPAVGTTYQGVPVTGPQIYISEESGGPYILQPPA